jgi:hypothetical protein
VLNLEEVIHAALRTFTLTNQDSFFVSFFSIKKTKYEYVNYFEFEKKVKKHEHEREHSKQLIIANIFISLEMFRTYNNRNKI